MYKETCKNHSGHTHQCVYSNTGEKETVREEYGPVPAFL